MSENTDLPDNLTGNDEYLNYWTTTTQTTKPLTEVESEFIREEIQNRDFSCEEDRSYIADLVKLEQYVLGEIDAKAISGGGYVSSLTTRHPEAYDRIQRELAPEEYRERKQEERKREREREQTKQHDHERALSELRDLKEEWEQVARQSEHSQNNDDNQHEDD